MVLAEQTRHERVSQGHEMTIEEEDGVPVGTTTVPPLSTAEICKVLLDKKNLFIGLILRVENDWNVAQDIYSLACVDVIANAQAQFRGTASLTTYLGTVMVNAARKHARSQSSRKNSIGVFFEHELGGGRDDDGEKGELGVEHEAANDLSPEKIVEQRQTLDSVQAVLARIEKRSPESYNIWYMHRIDGMSYLEIVEQSGIQGATCRSHVNRVSNELERLSGYNAKQMFA